MRTQILELGHFKGAKIMSVDYYVCKSCEDTFSDCGKYISCESCGTRWCGETCAEEDGYIKEHCSLHPDLDDYDLMTEYRIKHCGFGSCADCGYFVPDSCKYCREEDFDDDVLLEHALELLDMTRDELIARYKKHIVQEG